MSFSPQNRRNQPTFFSSSNTIYLFEYQQLPIHPDSRTYSKCSFMYANFVSPCPSTITSGQALCTSPSPHGRSLNSRAHFSTLLRAFSPVKMMPTCGSISSCWRVLVVRSAWCSVSAMWCSARTRREMRETSMRRMNASNSSGGRCGDARDRPRERSGITAELHHSQRMCQIAL